MKRRDFLAVTASLSLVTITGCGGGGKGGGVTPSPAPFPTFPLSSKGKVGLKVAWPPLTRQSVLSRATYLSVTLVAGPDGEDTGAGDEISAGAAPYSQTLTIDRSQSSVTFLDVPVGPAVITAIAFDEQNNEVGSGESSIVVEAGVTTQAQVTLDLSFGAVDTGEVEVEIIDNEDLTPLPVPGVSGPRQTLIGITLDPQKDRYARREPVNIIMSLKSPSDAGDIPVKKVNIRLYKEWQDPNSVSDSPFHRELIAELNFMKKAASTTR